MLKKIAKWTAIMLGAVVLLIGVAYAGLRLSDGPVEFFPWFTISIGGPFRSGELPHHIVRIRPQPERLPVGPCGCSKSSMVSYKTRPSSSRSC